MKKYFSLLFIFQLLIPLCVWAQSYDWQPMLNLYVFFPIFGLLAFSIMYSQMVVGTFSSYFKFQFSLDSFFSKTGVAVLVLFVMHPLLLFIAQFKSGASPLFSSVYSLVEPEQAIFLTLAMIAFTIFILYEFAMRLSSCNFAKKLVPFFEHLSSIGVILVWIHSINIGSHLQDGFLHYVWWFYGITAILMILYGWYQKLSKK